MRRDRFSDEHDQFRAEFRRFAEAEIVPHIAKWNQLGKSDREVRLKMGEAGFLGANAPKEYGGAGADFIFDAIIMEELAALWAYAVQASLHSDLCMPHLKHSGSEAQKQKYLTGAIAGTCLLAFAVTEPGSDLANG